MKIVRSILWGFLLLVIITSFIRMAACFFRSAAIDGIISLLVFVGSLGVALAVVSPGDKPFSYFFKDAAIYTLKKMPKIILICTLLVLYIYAVKLVAGMDLPMPTLHGSVHPFV